MTDTLYGGRLYPEGLVGTHGVSFVAGENSIDKMNRVTERIALF